ncbi:hypothetical protein F4803DRAFT_256540 [Xylaria telfairii]|nr:hypothetical protein F4803DRAFT_256540 [Xylaria telfairii]
MDPSCATGAVKVLETATTIIGSGVQLPKKPKENQSVLKHTKYGIRIDKEVAKEMAKDMAFKVGKAVVKWLCTPRPVLHPRQHPEWPGYTGIGTKLEFRLKPQVYDARCLVENTIASFFPAKGDRNLTPTQIAARETLISLFKGLGRNTKLGANKQPFGTEELSQFMRLLDEFFFFGALVKKGRPRVFFRIWTIGDRHAARIVSPFFDPVLPWGFTRDRYVRGYGPVSEIHVAGSTFYRDPVPLWFLVETLIHEMVHAYMHLFLCQCSTCSLDILNTCGLDGHGQTFLMLIDCIDQTMKSWGVGLTALLHGVFPILCNAGAACPHAALHDPRGFKIMHYDELSILREREKRFIESRSLPFGEQPSCQMIGDRRSSEEITKAKNKNEELLRGQNWKELNVLRPVGQREPGSRVYMIATRAGATKIEQSFLDRTGDIVQELLANNASKSSKKSSMKLNLPWPRTGNKDKPEKGESKDEPKKDEPKKGEPKKVEPKKDNPKKHEPKKGEPKKNEPKKHEPEKDKPKKHKSKKHKSKKDEPKKDEPKKDEPKDKPEQKQG